MSTLVAPDPPEAPPAVPPNGTPAPTPGPPDEEDRTQVPIELPGQPHAPERVRPTSARGMACRAHVFERPQHQQ